MKEPTTNILVPRLLDKTNIYANNLKNRISNIVNKVKLGNRKLKDITPIVLDTMYHKLRTGKDGKQLGYHSMYSLYKVVNVMFNQAIRWEIMDKNPNMKATKPKKEHKNFFGKAKNKEL